MAKTWQLDLRFEEWMGSQAASAINTTDAGVMDISDNWETQAVKNLQYHYRSKVSQVKLSAGSMLVDVPVLLQRSLEFVQHLEHVNQTALPLPSYRHQDLAGMSESQLGNMLRSPSVIRAITRPPLYPETVSASL